MRKLISHPLIRFALPLLVWLYVYHTSVQSMVSVWMQSKTYEHGFLIVPIALWLTWRKRDALKTSQISTAWIPIFLLPIPALIWMLGTLADIALFEHVALIVSLQLVLWATLGNGIARTLAFPIAYLVFCIPFGEELIPYLQEITADFTVSALQLSNIPVYREGLFFAIPNGVFEVAEACSGIRFLISSLAIGTLFAYLNFHSRLKFVAFVTFSFVFPIVANGLRAYGIVLVGYWSDMTYATGADHLIYGWFFFAIVTGTIFFVAGKFSDISLSASQQPSLPNVVNPPANHAAVVFLAVAILLGQHYLVTDYFSKQSTPAAIAIPQGFDEVVSSSWGVSFPNAQQTLHARSSKGGTELFIAKAVQNSHGQHVISHQNRLFDDEHWIVQPLEAYRPNPQFSAFSLISQEGVKKDLLFFYCVNQYCSSSTSKIKLAVALEVIRRNPIEISFTALFLDSVDLIDIDKYIESSLSKGRSEYELDG